MTKDHTEDNSVDNNNRSSVQDLGNAFGTESIDISSSLNNEWSHTNSNSPQQEIENSPQYVGLKERINMFCNQKRQKTTC